MGHEVNERARVGRALAVAGLLLVMGAATGCGDQRANPADSGTKTAGEAGEHQADRLPADATLAQALAHPDPLQRAARVAVILDESKPEELREIRDTFAAAPLPWGDIEYALFAGWWARFAPQDAIAFCQDELRARDPRVVAAVLRAWGQSDPQTASKSELLKSPTIDRVGLNPEYVDALVTGWFESGKPGLDEWVQSIDGAGQAAAFNAYMRMRVLRDGAKAALEWSIASPHPPEQQRLLLASALNVVARSDAKLAVEWLAIAEKRGIDVRTFVARIGRGWATTSPKDAMEWVVKRDVQEKMELARVVADITETWLAKDENGLLTWLATQKEPWTDLVRRQALIYHVRTHQYKVEWPQMIDQASTLLTEEFRKTMVLWVVQRWKLIEPEAATAWIEKNEARLGDRIKYVDQVPRDEFLLIRDLFPPKDGSAMTIPETTPGAAPDAALDAMPAPSATPEIAPAGAKAPTEKSS